MLRFKLGVTAAPYLFDEAPLATNKKRTGDIDATPSHVPAAVKFYSVN